MARRETRAESRDSVNRWLSEMCACGHPRRAHLYNEQACTAEVSASKWCQCQAFRGKEKGSGQA